MKPEMMLTEVELHVDSLYLCHGYGGTDVMAKAKGILSGPNLILIHALSVEGLPVPGSVRCGDKIKAVFFLVN